MKLDQAVIVLRPRSMSESLDLACRVMAGPARRVYLRLAAVLLLPLYAACLALHYAASVSWAWTWAIAFAASSLAEGAFTVAVGRRLFTEGLSTRAVLRATAPRLPTFAAALVLKALVVAATSMSVFVLTLPALSAFLFVPEATLLEGVGPAASLRRSAAGRGLVADLGKVLALLAAQIAIALGAETLAFGLLQLFQAGSPFASLWSDGGSPFALLGLFLAVPYLTTARFLLYLDERTRADGWDLQVRLMAIVASAETASREAA